MSSRIVMVGTFPPPMHGLAYVNSAVLRALREMDASPIVVDLSAAGLDRSWRVRLTRLPNVLRGLWNLGRHAGADSVVYLGVSGGMGQLYDCLFALLARCVGSQLVLHHHSWAYLYRPAATMRALALVAGRRSIHVALTERMKERFLTLYPRIGEVIVISNAVWMAPTESSPAKGMMLTLGYMANISREKGVFDFLDLARRCASAGLRVRAKLAGPFQDPETQRQVHDAISDGLVEYVGPKYGHEKDEFFATIDAFVFPTRYINECEPIVVHEAMQRGIPVIAFDRGGISEMVPSSAGVVVSPAHDFAEKALPFVRLWSHEPDVYKAAANAASQEWLKKRAYYQGIAGRLLRFLAGDSREVGQVVNS